MTSSKYELDLNDYEVIKETSSTALTTTYLVKDKDTSTEYNGIIINKDTEEGSDGEEEDINDAADAIGRLQHPTLAKFIGFSKTDFYKKDNITIITEKCSNGSLQELFNSEEAGDLPSNFDNTSRQIILAGISKSMMILHQSDFSHIELRPESVLLDDNYHPHLTDFYLSKFSKNFKGQNNSLPIYSSPETIEGSKFDEKTEVYSFGIIMYQIVTGSIPFKEITKKITAYKFNEKIMNGTRPVFHVKVKSPIKCLIKRCWAPEPEKRPTFKDLFKMLAYSEDLIIFDDDDKSDDDEVDDERNDEEDEDDNGKFFLDDIDIDKLNEYIESIKDDIKISPKTKKPTKKPKDSDDSDSDDKKPTKKPKDSDDSDSDDEKPTKKPKDSDDSDSDDKKPTKKTKDSDDLDSDSDDEKPTKKAKDSDGSDSEDKKPTKKTKKSEDSDLDSDSEDKKPTKKVKDLDSDSEDKKPTKKVKDSDLDSDSEDKKPTKKAKNSEDSDSEDKKPNKKAKKSEDSDLDSDSEDKKPTKKTKGSDDEDSDEQFENIINQIKKGEFVGIISSDVNDRFNKKKKRELGSGITSTSISIQYDEDDDEDSNFLVLKTFNEKFFKKGSKIDNDKVERYYKEIEAIQKLNDSNICKAIGFYKGNNTTNPTLLLQFFSNNLIESIKDLEDIYIVTIIYEISYAMMNAHSKNFIHRDLKPENILIDSKKHVKVSDFGISILMKVEEQVELCKKSKNGFLFLSPQLLQDEDYDEKVDVYSFGMLMYFMLTKGKYPKIKLQDVIDAKPVPIPKLINKVSFSIIKKCLSYLPQDRPSFKAIVQTIARNNFNLIDGIDSKLTQIQNHIKPIIDKKYLKNKK